MDETSTVRCICGVDLPEAEIEPRQPCAACGSTSRVFDESIVESANAAAHLGLKQKRGPGDPIYEEVDRLEIFRATGELRRVQRVIDRRNNMYREHITSVETGEVRRQVEERLDQHFGRGSAKSSKTNNPEPE